MWFHVHIPKTGGKTVLDVMRQSMPVGELHGFPIVPDGQVIPEYQKMVPPHPRAVSGHLRAFSSIPCPGRVKRITMLRKPLDRLVSAWSWFNQPHLENFVTHKILSNDLSFRDWVTSEDPVHFTSVFPYQYQIGDTPTGQPENPAQTALDNLVYGFECFGIFERMEDTAWLFERHGLGGYWGHHNPGPPKANLTEQDLTVARDRLKVEQQIYDIARNEIFPVRLMEAT